MFIYAHARVYACVHACGGLFSIKWLHQSLFHIIFETVSLPKPGAEWFGWTDRLASMAHNFSHGSWRSNSCFHACTPDTLLAAILPEPITHAFILLFNLYQEIAIIIIIIIMLEKGGFQPAIQCIFDYIKTKPKWFSFCNEMGLKLDMICAYSAFLLTTQAL